MEDDLFHEMQRIQQDIDRIFGRNSFSRAGIRTPLANVEETDKEIIATFELPGVDKKDIQLQVTEDSIEVKVEKKTEAKTEKKGYYHEERSYRRFYRKFSLPAHVLPEKSKASYKDGVLEVFMPKAETTKKKMNRISVQ